MSQFSRAASQNAARESSDNTHDNVEEKDPPNGEGAIAGSGNYGEPDHRLSQGGGDNAKDEEDQNEQFKPVGFWHPSLKHVRHEAMIKWTITTAVLMIFILGVLSIYWAVFYNVEQNLSSLVVYVIDFDAQVALYNSSGAQPLVGPMIVRLTSQLVHST